MGDLVSYIKRGVQPQYDEEGFIPALRTVNIRQDGFSMTRQEYINQDFYDANPRGQIQHGDILITSTGVGTLGRVAYNYERQLFFADGHITILRRIEKLKPLFVTAFLQSHIGLDLIERRQRGSSGQIEIYPSDISSISIPIMPIQFQNEIEQHYLKANQLREQSKTLYAEAEALLLHELGLDALDLSVEAGYEGSFAEMMAADRMDAEYFHPEKTHILETLDKMPGQLLRNYFRSVRSVINPPINDTGEMVYNYDLTDALPYFLTNDIEPIATYELGSTKKRFKHGDVVVSRLRSYLKEISIVTTSGDIPCVGSSEFIVLRQTAQKVSPELLLVYLRNPYIQKILKWCQNGSNHPRFDEKDLLNIKFPDSLVAIEQDILNLITQVFQLQQEAKRLLEEAKAQVEAMILGA